MSTDLIQFQWEVPEAGHQLRQGQVFSLENGKRGAWEPILTEGVKSGERRRGVFVYSPLKMHTGLFKTFAAMDADDDQSLLNFANSYGRLGGQIGELVAFDEGKPAPLSPGERVSNWRSAVREMARLVQLWDALKSNCLGEIAPFIIHDDDKVIYDSHPTLASGMPAPLGQTRHETLIASRENLNPDLFARLWPGDPTLPAWHYLQGALNDHLKKKATAPRLLWDDGRLGLFHAPTSLHAALWLQFAQAVGGGKEFEKCVQCSTSFERAPGIGRKGKKYCSDACRSAAYRVRKTKGINPPPKRKSR